MVYTRVYVKYNVHGRYAETMLYLASTASYSLFSSMLFMYVFFFFCTFRSFIRETISSIIPVRVYAKIHRHNHNTVIVYDGAQPLYAGSSRYIFASSHNDEIVCRLIFMIVTSLLLFFFFIVFLFFDRIIKILTETDY